MFFIFTCLLRLRKAQRSYVLLIIGSSQVHYSVDTLEWGGGGQRGEGRGQANCTSIILNRGLAKDRRPPPM